MLTTDRFRKRQLGIALGERSLCVAEAVSTGGAAAAMRVERCAEFAFPAGLTLERGEELGTAFAGFLKTKGFSTRRAILGIPAKWLMLKSHTLPPADAQTAANMLALHAESESAPELGDVVFDSLGSSDPTKSSNVLLLGLPRRWLDRVNTLAKGAKLKVVALTPCAASLACRTESGLLLSLRPDAAELVVRENGRVRLIRHLGSATAGPALMAELRRCAAVHPLGSELLLCDDAHLDDDAVAQIEHAVGMRVARANASSTGVCAAALATGKLEVNFLHPKLRRVKPPQVRRKMVWISTAAAIVALAVGGMYFDLARLQAQVTRSDDDLKRMEGPFKIAKPFVTNLEFAESFQGSKPPRYLAAIRDVTLMLPAEGQTYLTSFHLGANMKGEFAGRSQSDQDVLNLLDKLNAGGHFADLRRKLDARGNGTDVLFSVTFRYLPR